MNAVISFLARRSLACLGIALIPLLFQPAEARVVAAISSFTGTDTTGSLPLLLSQAGLYKNIAAKPRVFTDSIYPFEVNSPLWSDGSHKERFIQIPFGTKITPTDTDKYTFPQGTVLIKNFSIDTIVGDTNSRILVETRFLVFRTVDGMSLFSGITYQWRRNQSDAELVVDDPNLVTDDNGLDVIHNVTVAGVPMGKRWHYPSRAECNRCHIPEWRGSLGFITQQLNRPVKGNPSLNQLQDLFNKGVLSKNPVQGKPNAFRWRGIDDKSASLEVRARSYLAANCSHCHGNDLQKEWGEHSFDYFDSAQVNRFDDSTHMGLQGYIGKSALHLDALSPMFVYPGRPDSSFIIKRLLSRSTFEDINTFQMPPLATYQIDSAAVYVIRDWICALKTPATTAKACTLQNVAYDPYTDPVSISIRRNFMASRSGIKAYFQEGEIRVVFGHTMPSAQVALFDAKGQKVGLVPAGFGKFRVQAPLRSGLYFLKVGSQVLRLNHLR